MSYNQKKFLKQEKINKFKILFFQILLVITFLGIWEILVNTGTISAFIYSSPSRIIKTIISLILV